MTALPTSPTFSGDYAAAMLALGEDCPYRPEDFDARRPEVKGIPALIYEAFPNTDKPRVTWRMLKNRAAKVGARKALESIGIHCEDHLMPRTISATVDTVPEAPTVSVEPFDDVDDIADPPVPAGTIEEPVATPEDVFMSRGQNGIPDALLPLAHGFCQYLQNRVNAELKDLGIKMARDVESLITQMADFTKGVLASNEHAQYSMADALKGITERGLPVLSPPYQMTLQVTTPAGFPLTLTVTKTSAEELIGAMGKLDGWLVENGYTVPEI